jgi:hypothetical protein
MNVYDIVNGEDNRSNFAKTIINQLAEETNKKWCLVEYIEVYSGNGNTTDQDDVWGDIRDDIIYDKYVVLSEYFYGDKFVHTTQDMLL